MSRSLTAIRSVVAGLLLLALLGASATVASAAPGRTGTPERAPTPTATLSNGIGTTGDTVEVIGKDWPGQTIVQVQLCGNLHLNGSVDCLRSNAVTKAADKNGSFAATLVIGVPPAPCPCVVSIATFDGQHPIDLPYEVTGAPTATPKKSVSKVPEFTVTGTHVSDSPSLGSRFGLPDTRTVVTTIRNVGTIPIVELPVTLTYGRGDDPSRVVGIHKVRGLQPGQKRTLAFPIHTAALSAGSYTAVVSAGTGGRTIDDSATLSTFPWLLALLVTVVAIVLVVLLFTRLTRSRRSEPPVGPPPPPPGGYDPDALERELADVLQGELVSARSAGESPAATATRVGPAVAAAMAARYQLGATDEASLAAGLQQELAEQLGAPGKADAARALREHLSSLPPPPAAPAERG
ncbi:hypothetical protein [Aquihabitans sp. McL0605]|uniref:hypothetical protein n=1 Tax=Aquihabitans sp. McL0605 TaxID=3415671 RepID=UPI003CE9623C